MSDIRELENRITAALDQIGRGLEGLETPVAVDTEALDTARGALEDERTANAQLEERLRAVNIQNEKKLAELETAGRETRAAMETLGTELERLRAVNSQLRENNQALREANEAGVGEAHLINKAMMVELEALRANRAVDAAETGAVVAALTPLLTDKIAREDA